VDTSIYPTRDKPYIRDEHRMYFLSPRVQVIVFNGDISESQMRDLWGVGGHYGNHAVALVRDMKNMGKIGPRARKVVATEGLRGLGEPDAELRVYLANVSVLKRALVKLVLAAVRLATSQKVTIVTPGSFEEAVSMAQAYAAEYDREHGPVP